MLVKKKRRFASGVSKRNMSQRETEKGVPNGATMRYGGQIVSVSSFLCFSVSPLLCAGMPMTTFRPPQKYQQHQQRKQHQQHQPAKPPAQHIPTQHAPAQHVPVQHAPAQPFSNITTQQLLGGMDPEVFLREYWQKKPLLIRQAVPNFQGIMDRDAFLKLAGRKEATARMVIEYPTRRKGRFELQQGPFPQLLSQVRGEHMPETHWTVLVQGIETLVAGAWDILQKFSFLPAARVDDLMISYATPHGTVGPHDDAYDVFLLQGVGRRRWQIQRGGDRSLVPDEQLKLLRNFASEEEWVLQPGDMLYLPPKVAHYGVALDEGFTYSIGFLAPRHEGLVQNFLAYLSQEIASKIDPQLIYSDPDVKLPADPLAIDDHMLARVEGILQSVRWQQNHTEEFLGRLLTGPKPSVRFVTPEPPKNTSHKTSNQTSNQASNKKELTIQEFSQRIYEKSGSLQMALPSRGLVRPDWIFLNGEAHFLPSSPHTPTNPPTNLQTNINYQHNQQIWQILHTLLEKRKLVLPIKGVAGITTGDEQMRKQLAGILYPHYQKGHVLLQ